MAKTETLVAADEPIRVARPARRFVSRGGEKLDAALTAFGIVVEGRMALDAGASTGGFTDCLLRHGARHVVAVDVGYGQLDWGLRQDERVTALERTNARSLEPGHLPYRPQIVVADLSFISLRLVLPALALCAAAESEMVLLVKPQFEAGRSDVGRRGVVTDPAVWERVVRLVAHACSGMDVEPVEVIASPVLGPSGNVEFLLHAVRPPTAGAAGTGLFERSLATALVDGATLRAGKVIDG